MGTREPFVEGEWYHCYNRGVEKRTIFSSKSDYERFLMLMYASNSSKTIHVSNIAQSPRKGPALPDVLAVERGDQLVSVGAYCLMPTHFHLLIRPLSKSGVTTFTRKLGTGYTMYFNIRYERSGALFQGVFKAKRINTDGYFQRVLNYIHANPGELYEPKWKQGVIRHKRETREALSNYRFSSLPEYLGVHRIESALVDVETTLSFLEKAPTLEKLINEIRTFVANKHEWNIL